MGEGHAVVDLVDVALAAEASKEAADSFAGEASHAAEIFVGELHEEGEREVSEGDIAIGLLGASEVEEGAGELASGRGMEGEAAGGKDGAVVFARQGLDNVVADVGVLGDEAEEVGPGNGLDDAGGKGFGRTAVKSVLQERGEAEEVAGRGDAEEEKPAFAGGGGEFDSAAADDE
jgi:hypothetical protein